MLEEFGDEPAEAERLLFGFEAGDFFVLAGAGRFLGDEDQLRFELGDGFFDGEGLGGLRVGPEVEELMAVGLEDEDGECGWCFFGSLIRLGGRAQEGDCRQGQLLPVGDCGGAGTGFETECAGGFVEGVQGVGRGEFLLDEIGVEGDAVKAAQATEQPEHLFIVQYSPDWHSLSPRPTSRFDFW